MWGYVDVNNATVKFFLSENKIGFEMCTKAALVRMHVHLDPDVALWTCNQCFIEGKAVGKTYKYTGGTSNIVRHFEEFHMAMFQAALANSIKTPTARRYKRKAEPRPKREEVVIAPQVGFIQILAPNYISIHLFMNKK